MLEYVHQHSEATNILLLYTSEVNKPDDIDIWNEEVDHLMNVLNERMDELQPHNEEFVEDPFRDALDHMNDPDDDTLVLEEGEIIEEMN